MICMSCQKLSSQPLWDIREIIPFFFFFLISFEVVLGKGIEVLQFRNIVCGYIVNFGNVLNFNKLKNPSMSFTKKLQNKQLAYVEKNLCPYFNVIV